EMLKSRNQLRLDRKLAEKTEWRACPEYAGHVEDSGTPNVRRQCGLLLKLLGHPRDTRWYRYVDPRTCATCPAPVADTVTKEEAEHYIEANIETIQDEIINAIESNSPVAKAVNEAELRRWADALLLVRTAGMASVLDDAATVMVPEPRIVAVLLYAQSRCLTLERQTRQGQDGDVTCELCQEDPSLASTKVPCPIVEALKEAREGAEDVPPDPRREYVPDVQTAVAALREARVSRSPARRVERMMVALHALVGDAT
ncbi:MAG TPA: hypothetical protein VM537_34680, partial [Anaerolineae bacterium]|nr:hypothetical protein [Anaerolineae bacterium]